MMVRYSTSRLQALEQAKRLISHFPHARPPDVEGYASGLAEIFENYPIGVVEQCCNVFHGIAAQKSFLPAPAEVIAWCHLRTSSYLAVARRGPPKPEVHHSDEHCATMRKRLSEFFASFKAKIQPEPRKSDWKPLSDAELLALYPPQQPAAEAAE